MRVGAGVWRGIFEEGAVVVEFLKRGRDSQHIASDDAQTRRVVETLLDDVAKRGDAAVRELSIRFDNWDRDDYRLSDREIEACSAQFPTHNFEDIKFAKSRVRGFAEHRGGALRDIEVETQPDR